MQITFQKYKEDGEFSNETLLQRIHLALIRIAEMKRVNIHNDNRIYVDGRDI